MRRGKYKTKQKDLILSVLSANPNAHLTAQEIAGALKGQAGVTTVYRNLEALAEEGVLFKYDAPNGACYGRAEDCCHMHSDAPGHHCAPFYHFICVNCGVMRHLECDRLNGLSEHVTSGHGIKLDLKKTILYGSCGDCIKKGDML